MKDIPMTDLNVTLIQSEITWENPSKNLAQLQTRFEKLEQATDLVILPEMFSTGFTMNAAAMAEAHDGPSVTWMLKMSAQIRADIVGSVIIKSEDKYYNRLFWVKPDGSMTYYDKRHLFRMAGEHAVYDGGSDHLTVQLKDWRIRPFICYDLRFPAWCRSRNKDYDLAVFIANWPERRAAHWKTLLQARAIENQCYVIGVNRVGTDGLGIQYSGDSMIIDALGYTLAHLRRTAALHTERLSRAALESYREKFPAWMDADAFEITKE
jgi:predicted amidohydrolase